ncbi:MAG TPA: lysylphosphatidylglycerol synthase transmembrane domain-containing protein [Candidatus Binatia bacterium]|nr:lysylphosphatidylglycerol synthase transmembrane domain-containing protein [Candidatus Binatia bacterium]
MLRLAAGGAALAYAMVVHDLEAVLARLRDLDAGWLVVAAALIYGALMIRSVKWQSILACFGQREPLGRLWRLYVESCFFNLLFPGNVAGDLARITRSSTEGRFSVLAVMGVVLERLSGLLMTAVFVAVVALAGGYRGLGAAGPAIAAFSLLAVATLAVVPLGLRSIPAPTHTIPTAWRPRLSRLADQLRRSATLVTSHPRVVWRLLALSLVFVAGSGATAVALGRAIGSPIPDHLLMLYTPLLALVITLPLSVVGLGVRENLYVIAYSALGFPAEDALALALAESALLVIVSLSGGLLLWRPAAVIRGAAVNAPNAPRSGGAEHE